MSVICGAEPIRKAVKAVEPVKAEKPVETEEKTAEKKPAKKRTRKG